MASGERLTKLSLSTALHGRGSLADALLVRGRLQELRWAGPGLFHSLQIGCERRYIAGSWAFARATYGWFGLILLSTEWLIVNAVILLPLGYLQKLRTARLCAWLHSPQNGYL